MNKFQPVDFQDLDDLYAFLPDDELKMVKALRDLVYECIPEIKEKLSYNVPFFRLHRNICFIWPGSVPWGGTFEGVQLGFTKGYLLENEDGFLSAGKCKYVRIRKFRSLADIDFEKMRLLLFEAQIIDAETIRPNGG